MARETTSQVAAETTNKAAPETISKVATETVQTIVRRIQPVDRPIDWQVRQLVEFQEMVREIPASTVACYCRIQPVA